MKRDWICSPGKDDQWRLSHQPELHYFNTPRGQCIKGVTVGEKPWTEISSCLLRRTGDGLIHHNGNHYGPRYLKSPSHAVNSYVVDASLKEGAEGIIDVEKHL